MPHPDGSHRRLYCMESPESWFEDFGKCKLFEGCAEVPIDPDFAALVNLDDYHVFPTPYGGSDALVATERTARGFRVDTRNAENNSEFSWRVVAKRKDIGGGRLEQVTIPREPVLPTPKAADVRGETT